MNSSTDRSVAIRLGVTGDDQVEAALKSVGDTGDAATDRLAKGFQRLSDQAEAAAQRAAAAGQRIVAQLNVSNTANGAPVSVGQQQDAASRAYATYLADQARQAEALRNAIDPLRVAQAAYDRELGVANALLRSGNISEAEHAQAVKISTATYDRAKVSLGGLEGAQNKFGSSGLIADHVVRSLSDSLAAGQSPVRALSMEMGRITEAMQLYALQTGATEGAMGKFSAFMSGGWGVALTIGVGLLTALAGKMFDTSSASDKMAEHQKALADVFDTTTGRIKSQSAALLLNQQILEQGDIKAQRQILDQTKRRIGDAANDTQIFTGPGQGGASFQQDPRIVAAVRAFQKNGDADQLSRTVAALGNANPVLRSTTNEIISQASAYTLAKQKAAEYDAQIRILQGHQRPGDTRLARGQFGPEAPDLELADARAKLAAKGATEQQRAEAQATITRIESKKALDDNQISLKTYTERMAEADAAINKATADHKALTKAQQEAAKAARELAKLNQEMGRLNLGPMAAQFDKAFEKQLTTDWDGIVKDLADQQKGRLGELGTLVAGDVSQRNALAISKLELDTIGMSADKRQLMIDLLREQQRLQQQGVDLESDQAKNLLAGVAAQDAMNAALARASATMGEVRDFAGQLVDDLASGRSITKDLVAEFLKLAAINPLKNLINGNDALPTLGGIGKILGGLFGGGSGGGGALAGLGLPGLNTTPGPLTAAGIGHLASGTDYFGGGLTWVAENGPELVRLPTGTQVSNASATRRALAANQNGSPSGDIHLHMSNNFAGGAATMEDAARMAKAAYDGAISAIREQRRRAS